MPFNNFSKYPNRVFVETGSYHGNGIQSAIDSKFEEIYSIEISYPLHYECQIRFRSFPNVHLYLGDSSNMLWEIIKFITEPITFWLDGHWSDSSTGKGKILYPLLQELEQINLHPIKTHILLIDDVRLFNELWGFSTKIILEQIMKINPQYVISYDDGYVPNDVLVARVE